MLLHYMEEKWHNQTILGNTLLDFRNRLLSVRYILSKIFKTHSTDPNRIKKRSFLELRFSFLVANSDYTTKSSLVKQFADFLKSPEKSGAKAL